MLKELRLSLLRRQPFFRKILFLVGCISLPVIRFAHFGRISLPGFARMQRVDATSTFRVPCLIAALAPQCATQRMLHQGAATDYKKFFQTKKEAAFLGQPLRNYFVEVLENILWLHLDFCMAT